LRGWSYENAEEICPRGPGAGRSHGSGTHQNEHTSQWAAIQSIADKIGCTDETLRRWVRQAEVDQGVRGGMSSNDRERLKQLERENKELKRANEILRTASAFFAQAELDRKLKK
jgi:transposase-like protein